jgi:hypothetical protein
MGSAARFVALVAAMLAASATMYHADAFRLRLSAKGYYSPRDARRSVVPTHVHYFSDRRHYESRGMWYQSNEPEHALLLERTEVVPVNPLGSTPPHQWIEIYVMPTYQRYWVRRWQVEGR